MKKMIVKSILPGLLLMTLAVPGFAENRQGAYSLSPFIGGYVLDSDQHDEDRPIYGLRVGYNFTETWGAEAMLGYSLTQTEPKYGSRETDVYRYGLDALYHFMPEAKLVPFVAAGIGGTNFNTPNTTGINEHASWLFDYGIGLKYFVTPNVALRGDVRHAVLFNDSGNDDDSGNNNLEYALGLTFLFGGEKTVAEIAHPLPAKMAKDTTAPTVIFTSPVNGATAAPVNQHVSAAFSEMMDPASITSSTFTVKRGMTPVSGKVNSTGTTATFNPASDLEKGRDYTATMTTGVKDLAGNSLANNYVWNFTALAAPKVVTPVLISLEDSHFSFDSAEITENGKTILDLNIKVLKENPKMKIRIAGYASASGTDAYNKKLSEKRATAVKEYIVKTGGIDVDRLTTIGYGEENPAEFEAVPSDIYSEEAQSNMRVLFEIIIK